MRAPLYRLLSYRYNIPVDAIMVSPVHSNGGGIALSGPVSYMVSVDK